MRNFLTKYDLLKGTHLVAPTLRHASDDELLRRCILHEDAAWEELLRRHGPVIYYVIKQRLASAVPSRDGAAAEDVFGEMFERLLKDDCNVLRQVRNPSALRTYLCRIARRIAVDYVRREASAQNAASTQELYPTCAELSEVLATKETYEQLERAIRKLSAREQIFLKLYYEEGTAYKEIAEMTRTPIGTVGSVLHRARKALKELLEEQETPFP